MNFKFIFIIAVLCVLGVFSLIYILSGLKKGLKKTVIRLIFLFISIIVSVLLTKLIVKIVGDRLIAFIDGKDLGILNEFREASPTFENYSMNLLKGIVSPLLFFIVFLVICPLMKFVAMIFNKIFRSEGVEEKPSAVSKVTAVTLGFVCAFLMTLTLFMPVFTYLNIAVDVYSIANQENMIQLGQSETNYVNQIVDTKETPVVKIGYILSKPISSVLLTTKDSNGNKTNVFEELKMLADIFPTGVKISEMNLDDISKIDITPVNNLIDKIVVSSNLRTILAEFLNTASLKWKNNEEFLSINLKSAIGSNDLDGAIDVILEDFTKSTSATIDKDLKVLTLMFESVTSLYASLQDLDFENFENINIAPLNSCISQIESDAKLTMVIAEVLKSLGTKLCDDQPFMGQDVMANVEPELKNTVILIFNDFKNTSKEEVISDLRSFSNSLVTLSDIYTIFNSVNFEDFENINIADFETICQKIEDDERVSNIINQLLIDAGTAWHTGNTFMGVNIKDSMPTGFESAFDSTLNLFMNPDKTSYEKLDSFTNALRVFKYAQSLSNGNANAQDLEEFINNLNEDNADILKDLISQDVIAQVGGTDSNGDPAMTESEAAVISSILQQTIDNIVDPSITPEEERDKEAEAINTLLAFSNNLNNNTDSSTTGESEVNAYDMIETVFESNALSQSIIDYVKPSVDEFGNPVEFVPIVLDNEQREELNTAINDYIINHPDAEGSETIEAIKLLFDIA